MGEPAKREDLNALWEHHNTLSEEHNQLHREHIALKGRVEIVVQSVANVTAMIEDNRAARDAQHQEVMRSNSKLEKKIDTLSTAETKRDGMVQLGKYAAAFLTGLGTLVFLILALIDYFKS